MKPAKLNRQHLRYFLWGAAIALIAVFIVMNFDYARMRIFGLFSFWLPNALIWLVFLAIGTINGYLFARWEKRKKGK